MGLTYDKSSTLTLTYSHCACVEFTHFKLAIIWHIKLDWITENALNVWSKVCRTLRLFNQVYVIWLGAIVGPPLVYSHACPNTLPNTHPQACTLGSYTWSLFLTFNHGTLHWLPCHLDAVLTCLRPIIMSFTLQIAILLHFVCS